MAHKNPSCWPDWINCPRDHLPGGIGFHSWQQPLYSDQTNRGFAMNEQTTPTEGEPLIKPSSEDHPLYETICDACRSVHDPEIPVNIFELGLIYSIRISDDGHVDIDMSLTAPGCPVAGEMPGWVADAVEPIPGVKTVDVQLVWEPPWGLEMMSDVARLELGFI